MMKVCLKRFREKFVLLLEKLLKKIDVRWRTNSQLTPRCAEGPQGQELCPIEDKVGTSDGLLRVPQSNQAHAKSGIARDGSNLRMWYICSY